MTRVVRPELLDSLPPNGRAARANRHDLRRINRLLGNWRWLAQQLARRIRTGDRVLEAGAGDGALGRYLWRRVPAVRTCQYAGLDWRQDRPDGWPAAWAWRRGDLLAQAFEPPPRVLVVNLLLHQFHNDQLRSLGTRLADVPIWLICEPMRSRRGLFGLAMLRPLGLHRVSWVDGRTSICAGFRGDELVRLLDGHGARSSTARDTVLGSHRLISVSRPEDGPGGRPVAT